MSGDLIVFLRARLDEREAAASDIGDGSEVDRYSTSGHDRDVARAIHNQSRIRSGAISDVQVRHLLAIGYQRGQINQRGSAADIAAQRALIDDWEREVGKINGLYRAGLYRAIEWLAAGYAHHHDYQQEWKP